MYTNANSLYNKMTELMVLSETHDVQIICVTESCLNSDIVDAEVSISTSFVQTDLMIHVLGDLLSLSTKR